MYNTNRSTEYKGIVYKVVSVLENDLLLVVKKDDFEKKVFPMQTFLIPDVWVIEETKKLHQNQ